MEKVRSTLYLYKDLVDKARIGLREDYMSSLSSLVNQLLKEYLLKRSSNETVLRQRD